MGEERKLRLWSDGDMSREPELWIRVGACRRCGGCCESTNRPNYLMGLLDDDSPEGALAGPVNPQEAADGEDQPTLVVLADTVVAEDWSGRWVFWRQAETRHGPCPKWRGDGVCAVYGAEDFPHVCSKWPVFPEEMDHYPACGFRFIKVAEGEHPADRDAIAGVDSAT